MTRDPQPTETALRLSQLLATHNTRVVFAESCTAGMAAATLAAVPGISQWLCGSAVTYRIETKIAWLDVDPECIQRHTAESRETTEQMANKVLSRTAEADIAAAITGHLGPDAPPEIDGIVFISVARRTETTPQVKTIQHHLTSATRIGRQNEAANQVLQTLIDITSAATR